MASKRAAKLARWHGTALAELGIFFLLQP